MEEKLKNYGLVAEYKTVSGVYKAAEVVRDAGYTCWDVIAPFPIHGLDNAMGLKRSKVPFFTFFAGITGTTLAVLLVYLTNGYDYPLIVGGKPFFSPIYPFPVFFEVTILFAAFGTFFGMFITNKLPQHHHPLFEHKDFYRATDDHFWIVIECTDPVYHEQQTRKLLEQTGGYQIILLENK